MRGRWHGEAVTDAVGQFRLHSVVHLISRLRRQLPLIGEATGSAEIPTPSPGEGIWCVQIQKTSPQKGADQQIWPAPSIGGRDSTATSYKFGTPVSGGAYQNARKVTTEWNARPKRWCSPEFRGRKHPASPRTLFSPIFSLAREKIGPPEARQKRPRRNEPPQATSLILCARFFLSKPQTEFAVWVLSQICDNLSVSAAPSQLPWQGSLCGLRNFSSGGSYA